MKFMLAMSRPPFGFCKRSVSMEERDLHFKVRRWRSTPIIAVAGLILMGAAPGRGDDQLKVGERVYQDQCASCHGEAGQGVKAEFDEPLIGDKSLPSLVKYISKWMPEEDPDLCRDEEAEAVGKYVFDQFYSLVAQAQNKAAQVRLAHLTARQYRQSIADLVATFVDPPKLDSGRGLRGAYYQSKQFREKTRERVDPQIRFVFGDQALPDERVWTTIDNQSRDNKGFGVRWEGTLVAPDSGKYQIVLHTNQGFKLYLNSPRGAPLYDGTVHSAGKTRHTIPVSLVGGRQYPIRIEFVSAHIGLNIKKIEELPPVHGFVELQWKRPGRMIETIPTRYLTPGRASEVFVLKSPFPPDDFSRGYERGVTVSSAWFEATTQAAVEVAHYMLDRMSAGLAEKVSEDGYQAFAYRWVERAFRRPLSASERELYVDRQFESAPTKREALKRVIVLSLKSPHFLYVKPRPAKNDSYAVAARLALMMWDSLPDTPLLEMAKADALSTSEQIASEAARMIDHPLTRAKFGQFIERWLEIDGAPDLTKDADRFPDFDARLAHDLRISLDLFIEDVMGSASADFRRLLSSNELYLNGRMAAYYGYPEVEGEPFERVEIEKDARRGILTHPYVMARFAYNDTSSPIHRGVFLVKHVLGRGLKPPPDAITPASADLHPSMTTRERVSQQTKPRHCQSCHVTINGLGFALENFDADGRFRTHENAKGINAKGRYELATGKTRRFKGADELSAFLAESDETQVSFARQLFEHLVKQPIRAYSPTLPQELGTQFAENNYNMHQLIVDIVTHATVAPEPAPVSSE